MTAGGSGAAPRGMLGGKRPGGGKPGGGKPILGGG